MLVTISALAMLLLSGCGRGSSGAGGSSGSTTTVSLPPGVMSAVQACRQVVGTRPSGFFTDVKRVHLVLTSYAKGEPVESEGDINHAMPAATLVWVVEVHAKAINWNHSEPAGGGDQSAKPDTDYSVVKNAKTGRGTDFGECRCWPLPLSTVGTVISLPADC